VKTATEKLNGTGEKLTPVWVTLERTQALYPGGPHKSGLLSEKKEAK
jgi:hypothetical protein